MPSQPAETLVEDLSHIQQFASLAREVLTRARAGDGNHGKNRKLALYAAEERDLLELLTGIEERVAVVQRKVLLVAPLPNAFFADLPAKLSRYYWCTECRKDHWEDERPRFDEHVLYCGVILFGHRPALDVVK